MFKDAITKIILFDNLHISNVLYFSSFDRSSVFRIRKGIMSFDYCKEWNVIGMLNNLLSHRKS